MDEPIDLTRLERSGPPDDLWPAIADELDRRGKRRLVRRLSALAAAISVIVLASVFVGLPAPPAGVQQAATGSSEVTLAQLQATSAWLEARLSDQRRSVVDGTELESLLWLEAELAWLDEQLAHAPTDPELWRQRIELLAELNQRYADGGWRHDMLLARI